MERVSSVVKIEDMKNWNKGDVITITAGTGAGKSHLIKNNLYALAKKDNKKILMLIHRDNCVNQFNKEIEKAKKTDVIDIRTYQKLEWNNLNKTINDLSGYKYIVCDEFHYFMGDASFNKTTDISLNIILNQSNAIKIFMSATGNLVKRYLNEVKNIDTIDYSLKIKYEFIKQLNFFNKDETIEELASECIEKDTKCIIFIQSARKAYELHCKFKDNSLFNCSKSNNEYYRYVDKDVISNILEKEKFDTNILITTTCMDAGVNIIDENLKHIICDIEDIDVLIQCIGRKRRQYEDDKIHLYVKSISNNKLGGLLTQNKKKVKMANYLRKHTVKEFLEEFPRQHDVSNIIYDDITNENDKSTKVINELMYFKCKKDMINIEVMLNNYKNFGYNRFLAKKFGINYTDVRLIEDANKEATLENYLNSILGIRLYKKDQEELINLIGIKDARGRVQKGAKQLNAYLEENKYKFIICADNKDDRKIIEDGSKNPNRGKRYWNVVRTEL